ncbi:MAG: type II toxin-antitoxin system VapC family toxin [Desulfatitalea sp.]|nr:type II toxin-antitoxin system VapC family toxin [Desulfatitalea sp.]NNJ99228.1 type II toxin-antitoxin system VapC family toxin [Desulfatitalea sp.]
MLYVDTSALVALYVKEANSESASDLIRSNNEAIPKTMLHELEFTNAIQLKRFRHEMTEDEAGTIFKRFNAHEMAGVYFRPQIDWPDVFSHTLTLSSRHTMATGSRSLDILHVALAQIIEADRFFTFDGKQSELARAAGLNVV